MLAERARDAGAYVCYVNGVGGQDELVFDGQSLVFDPTGALVARARQFEEQLLIVDLDLEAPRPARRGSAPAADRRTPAGGWNRRRSAGRGAAVGTAITRRAAAAPRRRSATSAAPPHGVPTPSRSATA